MKYADHIKDSTTTAGQGALALSGVASTGYKPMSAAYVIGDAGIPYAVDDGIGGWEVGLGTYSAANTLARTTVLSSSAAGDRVSFGAGQKSVIVTLPAAIAARGLVDETDIGFDVVLLCGQSNMAGWNALDISIDTPDAGIFQFGGKSGDARYRTIFGAADPLHHYAEIPTGKHGVGSWAAKTLATAIPQNRRLLLVPAAQSDTKILVAPGEWLAGSPGNVLYENAIAQANLAISAAQAMYPKSRFVGAFYHQGESDAGQTQAAYYAALAAIIAGFRVRITGASLSWFVLGGMVPEYISGNTVARGPIDLAHQQIATTVSRTAFAAGPAGFTSDSLHYNGQGIRIMGARMGAAVAVARYYLGTPPAAAAPVASGVTITGAAAVGQTLTGSYVYSDVNGDVEGASTFRWLKAGAAISGAVATTYAPVTGDIGAALVFEVTPVALTGSPLIGTPVQSAPTSAVTAAATAPGAPTALVATAGNTSASVAFSAPSSNGGSAITGYTVTSTPGGLTASGASSPITVAGLTNGTSYTFTAVSANAVGPSAQSVASNAVVPSVASSWSPTDKHSTMTLSGGNLTVTSPAIVGDPFHGIRSTTSHATGKWYFEVAGVSAGASAELFAGIVTAAASLTTNMFAVAGSWGASSNDGSNQPVSIANGVLTAVLSGGSAVGTVIGYAVDLDAHTMQIYVGGVLKATLSSVAAATYFVGCSIRVSTSYDHGAVLNCGATAFAFAPPSGYAAW